MVVVRLALLTQNFQIQITQCSRITQTHISLAMRHKHRGQSRCVHLQVSKQLSGSVAVLKAGPPPIETPAMLSAAELEKPVCIRLEESDTIWLLNLPGGCINADTNEGKAVEVANAK